MNRLQENMQVLAVYYYLRVPAGRCDRNEWMGCWSCSWKVLRLTDYSAGAASDNCCWMPALPSMPRITSLIKMGSFTGQLCNWDKAASYSLWEGEYFLLAQLHPIRGKRLSRCPYMDHSHGYVREWVGYRFNPPYIMKFRWLTNWEPLLIGISVIPAGGDFID